MVDISYSQDIKILPLVNRLRQHDFEKFQHVLIVTGELHFLEKEALIKIGAA